MQFTMWLDPQSAQRVKRIVEPMGGTVGAYAANWAKLLSLLPSWEQDELRSLIETKISRLAAQHASPMGQGGLPVVQPPQPAKINPQHRKKAAQPSTDDPKPRRRAQPNEPLSTPAAEAQPHEPGTAS